MPPCGPRIKHSYIILWKYAHAENAKKNIYDFVFAHKRTWRGGIEALEKKLSCVQNRGGQRLMAHIFLKTLRHTILKETERAELNTIQACSVQKIKCSEM